LCTKIKTSCLNLKTNSFVAVNFAAKKLVFTTILTAKRWLRDHPESSGEKKSKGEIQANSFSFFSLLCS